MEEISVNTVVTSIQAHVDHLKAVETSPEWITSSWDLSSLFDISKLSIPPTEHLKLVTGVVGGHSSQIMTYSMTEDGRQIRYITSDCIESDAVPDINSLTSIFPYTLVPTKINHWSSSITAIEEPILLESFDSPPPIGSLLTAFIIGNRVITTIKPADQMEHEFEGAPSVVDLFTSLFGRSGPHLAAALATSPPFPRVCLNLQVKNTEQDKVRPLIVSALESLFLSSAVINLSVDILNSSQFELVHDVDAEVVRFGFLTAEGVYSSDGVVLIDETTMAPGQLDATGLKNLNLIKQVITEGSLTVSTKYGNWSFTGPQFVFLSGGKSLFGGDLFWQIPNVKVQDSASLDGLNWSVSRNQIRRARQMFLQRNASMSPEVEASVTDFVVNVREEFRVPSHPYIRDLITMIRAFAVSRGSDTGGEITMEDWISFKQAELPRLARIDFE